MQSTPAPPSILDLIAGRELPTVRLGPGEKLFLKGDGGGAMLVVTAGEVEVLLDGRLLETVGPGGIVGELALLDGIDRSAAALTVSAVEAVTIDRPTFLALVAAEPRVALAVLCAVSARLRRANQRAS
jgi:CRP-like cAMP-binding protein